MDEWKVPGLAVAVVQNGDVILSEGYGYRDLDEQLPVTSNTLFAIGSSSKSFTVAILGMLVDDGLLDWDEPVQTYLPDFRLMDPVATQQMTPRDLVTHRSGLPRHDLVWYGSGLTRAEMYQRLRYLEPNEEFRAVWQYQNLMYMTAGYLAGQVTGSTWEALVRARIFQPLRMGRSNTSVHDSQMTDDFAYPYAKMGETVHQIDFRNIDEIGPAGSINSSASAMIRYVQLLLQNGKYGEEQLLSEANARQMQTPQMAMSRPIRYQELGHTSYGMGLFITTYRGELLVHHGGNIDGFSALLSFMPHDSVGVIVLTNLSSSPVPTIVTRGIYDRILGLPPVDWSGLTRERLAENEGRERAGAEPVAGTSLSHELIEYAGEYGHPAYGVITITVDGERLRARYRDHSTPLEHFHYDVFELPENPRIPFSGIRVLFRYNKAGTIDQLLVPLEPAIDDILFTRIEESEPEQD
jgi:CubicO group peptidase (beta-lactamase class C family)